MLRIFRRDVEDAVPYGFAFFIYRKYQHPRTMPDPTYNLPLPGAPITVWLHALPHPFPNPHHARPCVPQNDLHRSPNSLSAGTARWFTKNSVYFLCKVCYTVISVYRTGQFRANQKKKYANVYAGREAIYQTIQGQRGWGWPLGIFAHFLRKRTVLKGVYE